MIDFKNLVKSFFSDVAMGAVEIYNEISLQHEFGLHLRTTVGTAFKTQFERPVSFFGLHKSNYVKKEIDVSVFTANQLEKYAIELKYPRNGQHPEQMFKACQDICFLEQLRHSGFTKCCFVIVVDDPLFYSHGEKTGIYQFFRAGIPICGNIHKPTGARDGAIEILGNYFIIWNDIDKNRKYAVVEIV
ncbi:MAG: hypothetical protein ACOYYU_03080 [Chloroflexota bacterium]